MVKTKEQFIQMLNLPAYRHIPDDSSGVEHGHCEGNYFLQCSMGFADFGSSMSLEELQSAYQKWAQSTADNTDAEA